MVSKVSLKTSVETEIFCPAGADAALVAASAWLSALESGVCSALLLAVGSVAAAFAADAGAAAEAAGFAPKAKKGAGFFCREESLVLEMKKKIDNL